METETTRPTYPDRHPAVQQLARHFAFGHLKPELAAVSEHIADLADLMIAMLPDGAELSTGLRKLLEAKDCFVRAAVEAPPMPDGRVRSTSLTSSDDWPNSPYPGSRA